MYAYDTSMVEHRTNYSLGYVVEILPANKTPCEGWLLLPAENLWPVWLRGMLYICALLYLFVGIAIGSDIFMCSIEVITSKKRKVIKWDDVRKERVEHEILIWNETVANLTLLALGSSAPEILLAVIEALSHLGRDMSHRDGLGAFTIIGSAAFNLLIITSICIVSVPKPQVKHIREFGVFLLTAFWSMWAYVWMLLVVQFISPGEIEIWEALVTLSFFPLFVILAYCQDNGWWCRPFWRKRINNGDDLDLEQNMRVMDVNRPRSPGMGHISGKDLYTLETLKNKRMSLTPETKANGNEGNLSESQMTLQNLQEQQQKQQQQRQQEHRSYARARFRHAVVMAMMGKNVKPRRVPKMADIVTQVQQLKSRERNGLGDITEADEGGRGTFSFASSNYAIMESTGVLEVDILFNRRVPRNNIRNNSITTWPTLNNGSLAGSPITTSAVSVAEDIAPYLPGVKEEIEEDNTNGSSVDPPLKEDVEEDSTNGSPVDPPVTSEDRAPYLPDVEMPVPILLTEPDYVCVDYETREGSAKPGRDFTPTQGRLTFNEDEFRKTISIPVLNPCKYENDVDFYILLKNPSPNCGLGDPSVSRITIIDDDEPGVFLFDSSQYQADLTEGKVTVTVVRHWGCDGKASIEYSTIDGTAIGGQCLTEGIDYLHTSGTLTFKHAEMSKDIVVHVHTELKGVKNFIMSLRNPSVGAKIGETSATVCNITSDALMDRLADLLDDDGHSEDNSYSGQFKRAWAFGNNKKSSAMVVGGGEGEEQPKCSGYVLHFCTFFWKIFFAFVPPPKYLGAWPTFVISLSFVGILTFFVEQLGNLLGCVVGLENSVTGITIIALGTSLPDTFASRTAARHDEHADAAIGNITGSNSVNVFLGLGLPWIIQSVYAMVQTGGRHKVSTSNLSQSVIIFSICGCVCILTICLRRKYVGGELGGVSSFSRLSTSAFLLFLWFFYVTMSSLKAYGILVWDV